MKKIITSIKEKLKRKKKKPVIVLDFFQSPLSSLLLQSISPNTLSLHDEILSRESENIKLDANGELFSDVREDICYFPIESFAYKIIDGNNLLRVYYPPIGVKERDVYLGNRIFPAKEKIKRYFYGDGLSELIEKEDTQLYHDKETGVRKGRGYLGIDTSPFVTPHCDLEIFEKFYNCLSTPPNYSKITSLEFEVPKEVAEAFKKFLDKYS